MSWSPELAKNDEASKCRWDLVPYMRGRMLDIGCGGYKVFPHAIGVDNGKEWPGVRVDVPVDTAERLDIFASQFFDCVFSSHLLEHIEDYKSALKEWWRVVKHGGYLILYLPHKLFYPNIGTVGSNLDHKHDFMPEDILAVMREIGGVEVIECEDRNENDEYSFFQVFRKIKGREFLETYKAAKPAKTAAVIRYAAIGDAIQASSVLPWLKENGYHVTFYCQAGAGHEVLLHDPHIDRFIVQGKDQIPPAFLQEFWDHTKKKYDKWINLCESVEGTLLAVPGRPNHEWPNEVRAKYQDRNYLEWTHEIAQVPPPYRPKFYPTLDEKAWARRKSQQFGKRNILWSLSGSSGHKAWPHLDTIIARIMLEYPDTHVQLVGDEFCRILETGWEDEPRVHCLSGKWTIRQSMAFAEVSDLIVGTETGLLNAAGSMDVPKIITLSHSSPEMLTKHWKNVTVLQQPAGGGCPKFPCRQLHYGWDYCMQDVATGTAVCQNEITAEMMWDAITAVLGNTGNIERMVA